MTQHERPLDRIDRQILAILQEHGRLSVTELAARVNLTATPCGERVKRLEADGFIDGYSARVNAQRMGMTMLVYMLIRLEQSAAGVFNQFAQAAELMDEIEECSLVTGDFDVLLKIRVKDMQAYRDFMNTHLHKLPGVTQTKSQVVIEQVKNRVGISI